MSEALREQLQQVYDDKGELTPNLVVDVARDPAHPLHGRFEWDDAVAGEAWRREQAHQLITSVRVVYRQADDLNDERKVRAFQAVPTSNGHTYVPADKVASDPFMTQLVLQDMEREWRQLHRRYGRFEEFVELVRRDVADPAA